MSISRKTQGSIIFALIFFLAILYFALRLLVLQSFDTLERRYAEQNRVQVDRAISDQLALLDRSVMDYAVWDDTYAFLQGDIDNYVVNNFTDLMFVSNQLDVVAILDTDGVVRYQRVFDLPRDLTATDQTMLLTTLLAEIMPTVLFDDKPHHMVVLMPQAALMISMHQVLHSDGHGPSNGLFFMGRWIDAELAAELSARLQLDVAFFALHHPFSPDLPTDVLPLLQFPARTVTVPLDADHLGSYSTIRDTKGDPVVITQVTSGRPIWFAAQRTILITLSIFLIAGSSFIVGISLLLDQIILSRLRTLVEGVQMIGAQQDLTRRVALDGTDELSHLAQAINQTMTALEEADHDRREAEAEREALMLELNEARRIFIATISHELRTPLTPIRGYVDMMVQGFVGELNSEQSHFLSMIQQNSLRMEALVNDLMVLGQLDAGHIQIEPDVLVIEEMVHGVLPMFEQKIMDGNLHVLLDFPANLPHIYADHHRVEQILANLLSNAVKYTPVGGEIHVSACRRDDTFLELAVSDTGIGMSVEEQERLFTPFYRTNGALRSHIPGTGLGLSIVHSLVQLHGGCVEVVSAPNEGSTFRITLPIYVPPAVSGAIQLASYTSTAAV